jgi:amidohydrolase
MSVNLDPSFLDRLRESVQIVLPDIIALRHDLHAHPELSGEEKRTAEVVSQWLTKAGIAHETGVGGTHGVVAIIESGAGANGPTFALRGDMDALPILEENDVDYKSQNPGVMHACGHDGHTSNLMGTALVLNRLKDALPPGRVKFLFQPAEETVRGADALVGAGAIDDVDAIVMLHGWPKLPVGQIGVRNGPVMASSDTFKLIIKGKGGHGAYPHDTFDPIMCGAQIVTALQTLVSREIIPVAPAVVSVTMFHAGTARNIIPEQAEICGTVRTLDPELRDTMAERVERIIAGVCSALRCEYEIEYTYGTPVTVNDSSITDLVRAVGADLLGAKSVVELAEPTMGAEDFAYYVEKIPGSMFRLGTGCEYLLHTPKYNFGDDPLETGILLMAETARRFLAQGDTAAS